MALRRTLAADAIAHLAEFDAIVDARSESEFAEDRLPGAVNWPTLNDAQRHQVGTEYKQVSPFEARKHGATMAARNIADHIERHLGALPREWRPLVYCWRGGQRSGALAAVLDQIGFTVHVLEGGYREFRRAVIAELETLPSGIDLRVLCGRTGSGKSRLLGALAAQGAQVLDLEAIACHRGSVLGPLPGVAQPSQKAFETDLWRALRGFDAARPVFTEGESRTIGRLRLPERLLEQLRAAPCLHLEMPIEGRVALLAEDYRHFVRDPESLCERLAVLREARGAAVVAHWQALAREGRIELVHELLTAHYDPTYLKSMQRNFVQFDVARTVPLADGSAATLAATAAALIAGTDPLESPAPPAGDPGAAHAAVR